MLHLEKWALGRDSTKFTSIYRESLYMNLYGSRTLAYWAKKDHIPTDPKRILGEESRLAMKRTSRAQRRIDIKILCNSCGFEKIKFDRREQDTHLCPVCQEPREDRNHLFTCKAPTVVTNREKNFISLTKLLKDLDTAPTLEKMIIGSLRHVHNGTTPYVESFGHGNFGGGIRIRGIMEDQANIGWINFLCKRWGVKWKEAQKRHNLRMNKKKLARLSIIAILKKIMMIQ